MDMFDQISVPSDEQMEPGVLLEESWFFGNLLDRKSRMLRCYSDPCPNYKNTQDFSGGKSMEETFSSLQKLPQGEKLNLDSRKSKPRLQRASSEKCSSMQRAPSLPVFVDYKEEPHDEESDFSMGKLIRQASINQVKVLPPKHNNTSHVNSSLQRAPSLPVFQESEQIHDVESDFSMGKLIRQASLNHSKVPNQKHTSQVLLPKASQSSNLQRAPSLPISAESDFSINKVKVSPQKHTSQLLLPKASSQQGSSSSLQRAPSLPVYAKGEGIHEEQNEFSMGKLIRQASLNHAKVLPPKHNSKGLTRSPSISSITKHHIRRKQVQESMTRNFSNGLEVEDLQGFKNLDLNNENKESTPKFANTTPGLLKDKNKKKPVGLSELDKIRRPPYSSEDHMKEQIKYWARAVASNVR